MTFLWEQGIPVIKLDMIATLALAILLLLLGRVMVNRIGILGAFFVFRHRWPAGSCFLY